MLSRIALIFFWVLVVFNLFLSAWHVLHNDIVFSADIARDFHLFREIDEKKIILIGPRSSVSGLFHGPAWLYLNYPAYLIGKGNPIVVGWYWIFLTALFLIVNFKIAEKLFDRLTAYLYVLQLSVYAVFHSKGLFNPQGVFFLLPMFYFLLLKYLKTNNICYLVPHVIVGGLLIQFQIAIGIPYVVLSSFLIIHHAFKNKNKAHILALLLIPISLCNFIIFDFRHDFPLFQAIRQFFLAHQREKQISYLSMIKDDLRLILTGTEILRANPIEINFNLRIPITIIFAFFTWLQIKSNLYKKEYLIFLYLYLGFFLLSFANKGFILYFYFYPQFSLAFLIFASFVTSNYKKIFIPIFLVIFAFNFYTAIKDTKEAKNFIGKNPDSWKFLFNLSQKVYQQPEEFFGYFVFSPDAFGYQPRYAMIYTASFYDKQAFSFEKKPITYLIAAPHPFMKDRWWKENQMKITSEPELIIPFENGYKIEKYLLNKKQIEIPFDPSINPGIHFR